MKQQMLTKIILFIVLMIFNINIFAQIDNSSAKATNQACYPALTSKLPQYIIGYGSLINAKSKLDTYTNTGDIIPVMIQGYQRGWFTKGLPIGFSTTFLGVIKNSNAKLNAVIFKMNYNEGIGLYDEREKGYCRKEVLLKDIQMMNGQSVPNGQYWIYVTRPEAIAKPSVKYPIVQSYVDIFLSGCLEVEKNDGLINFAHACIDTTTGWSKHWVNDRIFPRRPFQHQPNASKIDKLLSSKLKNIFNAIKIE